MDDGEGGGGDGSKKRKKMGERGRGRRSRRRRCLPSLENNHASSEWRTAPSEKRRARWTEAAG